MLLLRERVFSSQFPFSVSCNMGMWVEIPARATPSLFETLIAVSMATLQVRASLLRGQLFC